MGGSFACPECGEELAVAGITPGREVVCPECSTLVEVPYLPRVAGRGARRGAGRGRASPWLESGLLRAAVAFATLALVGLAAGRVIGGRARSGRERVLAELIADADRAEAAGKPGPALSRIEAALARARAMEPEGSARLADLARRRDLASARDARARLDALDALDPDAALGEALTLAKKAAIDGAVAPLREEAAAKVEASRRRQAEADLDAARRALGSADGAGAFAAASRLDNRSGRLAAADAGRLRPEAEAVIREAVARFGVIVAGPDGPENLLTRPLAEALTAQGYLVPPRRPSPWLPLWDEHAPFRATARVAEVQEDLYLQSKNRITRIEGSFELIQRGRTAWQGRISAQTRTPLPDLPAYLAGRLATAARRDPEIERRLQADARAVLAEQAAKILRGLPAPEAVGRGP